MNSRIKRRGHPLPLRKVLIRRLEREYGFSNYNARLVWRAFMECLAATFAAKKGITIPTFGSLMVIKSKAHRGWNPKLKQIMIVPEKMIVRFRASPILKDLVNDRIRSEYELEGFDEYFE